MRCYQFILIGTDDYVALVVIFSRTLQVVMNLKRQVDLKREETLTPLTLDQALALGVILDQIHQQKITVMKPHRTMSLVPNSKAENLQPSKWTDLQMVAAIHNSVSHTQGFSTKWLLVLDRDSKLSWFLTGLKTLAKKWLIFLSLRAIMSH